jgi:1,4-alpha-glucan branching enzyme
MGICKIVRGAEAKASRKRGEEECVMANPTVPGEKKTTGNRVQFNFRAEPGKKVFVAGTFNDWNPSQYALTDADGTGCYAASVDIPAGHIQYKFVVDGVWCVDPECPDWVRNQYGSLNSVMTVRHKAARRERTGILV